MRSPTLAIRPDGRVPRRRSPTLSLRHDNFRSPSHFNHDMKTFKNFIGGDWVPPVGGEYFENRNPADINDEIGRFPMSGVADVQKAVESAKRGFEIWRA